MKFRACDRRCVTGQFVCVRQVRAMLKLYVIVISMLCIL